MIEPRDIKTGDVVNYLDGKSISNRALDIIAKLDLDK